VRPAGPFSGKSLGDMFVNMFRSSAGLVTQRGLIY
jgi:hypothetical protein